MTEVRHAEPADASVWLQMRRALWPEGSEEEHAGEIARYFAGEAREPLTFLSAVGGEGRALGLAEPSIRPSAEECRSQRVAYLGGWYVTPEARRRGAGAALVSASEGWARSRGCTELASDTAPDNEASAAAHLVLGFEDAGVVRCFRKDL